MQVTAVQKVLPFISNFQALNSMSPSYREIAKGVGKSLQMVAIYLRLLQKAKYIKLSKRSHRDITILKEN